MANIEAKTHIRVQTFYSKTELRMHLLRNLITVQNISELFAHLPVHLRKQHYEPLWRSQRREVIK